jgi:carbamoyl-phosphate synthase large subunit
MDDGRLGAQSSIVHRPSSVLVIGSGPIVIGQAAEFDYAGTQACKALREEGVRSILVNSNPATIMTDEDVADVVYIEPLAVEVLERIIAAERPDALLPTLGGQTGLNLAVELAEQGILDRYGVRLLGAPLATIKKAEDRELFKEMLLGLGEPVPESKVVDSWDAAQRFVAEIGLPLVIRPAFTLGGTGGGIATTPEDFERIVRGGLAASPIHQVLLERSLVGWKEIEYEVMRDGADNCIIVCNMENIDPMGVHTGDSIVVAPTQTLTDKEHQMLRSASLRIIRALGIEGGCNIQFALAPNPSGRPEFRVPGSEPGRSEPGTRNSELPTPYAVIEVNPRVSRSSALASKATGYPIARVAAKIAVGRTLDEIPNAVTKRTRAAFEPALDYCVVKIPRWPFDKFAGGDRSLGTQMKATGEVMAIERTFAAAFQKAVRSLEIGSRTLLWEDPAWSGGVKAGARGEDPVVSANTRAALAPSPGPPTTDALIDRPNDERLWALLAALRRGCTVEDLNRRTGIDCWFLEKFRQIVQMERRLLAEDLTPELLRAAKRMGFSDEQVGTLADRLPQQVRELRAEWDIRPVYKMVDTCAAEFDAVTPYFYSTYERENEAEPLAGARAVVVGSGPIRIGQGIEFDYCSVHSAWALDKAGVQSIMVNSNPETVSTDFDTSSRLYFDPLDAESVLDILENEGLPGTIVQFGGQTAINLAEPLTRAGMAILGSGSEAIDLAEDRRRFEDFLAKLGVPQPPGAAIVSAEEALRVAQRIGYPVLVRPSYVLGGRAMEIVYRPSELVRYMAMATQASQKRPVLIDKYLEGKEVEVDAICDGERVFIPGIMEHIERAGVHSGDSMAVYPGLGLTTEEVDTLVEFTIRIGQSLGVRGLMNVQYVIVREPAGEGFASSVYVLEVNPRSSRTVPFLSKVTDVPMVQVATNVMLGRTLAEQGYPSGLGRRQRLVAIKAPVFSMSKLAGVDTYLGPEMKSTGEVMGIDRTFAPAMRKALMAAGLHLPPEGAILLSIADKDKPEALPIIRRLVEAGYRLFATEGTAELVRGLGMPVEMITKRLREGYPNVVDVIREGRVNGVINTITGDREGLKDGFDIRRAAAEARIPCFTSLDTARVAVDSLVDGGAEYSVLPLPAYRDGGRSGYPLAGRDGGRSTTVHSPPSTV